MKKLILSTISVFILISATSQAQDLPEEKVEVVKDFEARLADANKIKLDPEAETKEVSDQKFNYEVVEKILPIEYLPPTIRPASVRTEDLPASYDGFVFK